MVIVMQHWTGESYEFGNIVAGYLRHVNELHRGTSCVFTYLTRSENYNGQLPHIDLVRIVRQTGQHFGRRRTRILVPYASHRYTSEDLVLIWCTFRKLDCRFKVVQVHPGTFNGN